MLISGPDLSGAGSEGSSVLSGAFGSDLLSLTPADFVASASFGGSVVIAGSFSVAESLA